MAYRQPTPLAVGTMKRQFTAILRIAMLQVSLGVTVVSLCLVMDLLPDHRVAEGRGRERLCESLALNGTAFIQQQDLTRWQAILDVLVERQADLLSAAVRKQNGKIVAEAGPHQEAWPESLEKSTDEFMKVPIHQGTHEAWGHFELRFTPLMPKGIWMSFLLHPWTRYTTVFACIAFPIFYWNLRKVFQQLDPTKAVPRNVSQAYDFLAGALVGLNTKQEIVLCNAAFLEIVGMKRDQLVGKKLESLAWAGDLPDEYPWHAVHRTRSHEYGASLNYDSPTAGRRALMVNAAPIIGQADNYAGTLVGFEDITPLEETKAELEKSKEAAEAANAAKSAFLANMSHEIRTPMNAILGFADIMRRGLDESELEREQYLGIIHSSGEHLLALINDILDLSKVESGRMQIEVIECQPHIVIHDTLSTFRVRAEEKGIQLDFRLRNWIPATIQSDPLRLRQVLTNLVGNAIKFTEKGGVRIECEFRDGDDPKLAFHVVDSGIGISQENIEKVFQPFSQADSSTTRKYGGTGLGLSISRRLAELMGGDLSATSVPGEGSVFTVQVAVGNVHHVEMLDETDVRERLTAVHKRESTKHQLPPGHVLVVDDGEANRRLVRLVLERGGVTSDEAVDGQAAVEMVGSGNYDIVLMDVQMPRMDGITAARTMRAAGVDCPIVALTAHALGEQRQQFLEAGYSHVVTKPVDIDELLALVAELLGGEVRSVTAEKEPIHPEPKTSPPTAKDEPQLDSVQPENAIVSDLPMDDEDFRAIAEEFVTRFGDRFREMVNLWAEKDFETLAKEAHWLKGAGGTAGFAVLTQLGKELETAAKRSDDEACELTLADLESALRRLWVPPQIEAEQPIKDPFEELDHHAN